MICQLQIENQPVDKRSTAVHTIIGGRTELRSPLLASAIGKWWQIPECGIQDLPGITSGIDAEIYKLRRMPFP